MWLIKARNLLPISKEPCNVVLSPWHSTSDTTGSMKKPSEQPQSNPPMVLVQVDEQGASPVAQIHPELPSTHSSMSEMKE